MTIVLNEHEWAEEMIASRSLGKKPYETLCRVARYYLDENYGKKTARKMLDTFLLQCDPSVSLPKWANTLDNAVNRAAKYPSIQIDGIGITAGEMERIQALGKKQLERLAFTLLCLSKYWMAVNPRCDWWVNNKDSDIMKLANINTSIKRQSVLYHELNESGMIEFSRKVGNTNVRVCFAEDAEPAITVSDFRNLGYQYLYYTGSRDYIKCKGCGIVVRKNRSIPQEMPGHRGAEQIYCSECSSHECWRKTRARSV